jgi:hypothetical protein
MEWGIGSRCPHRECDGTIEAINFEEPVAARCTNKHLSPRPRQYLEVQRNAGRIAVIVDGVARSYHDMRPLRPEELDVG